MPVIRWIILSFLLWPLLGLSQQAPAPEITAPEAGGVLQGLVQVKGTTDLAGFQSCQVEYAYQNDKTGTWYPIPGCGDPVNGDVILEWDTSGIADGVYRLRLVVRTESGPQTSPIVEGLRVRNYTAIETPTPDPTAVALAEALTPTVAPSPTPTASASTGGLPGGMDLTTSLTIGGLVALGLFVALIVILAIRTLIRGGK